MPWKDYLNESAKYLADIHNFEMSDNDSDDDF